MTPLILKPPPLVEQHSDFSLFQHLSGSGRTSKRLGPISVGAQKASARYGLDDPEARDDASPSMLSPMSDRLEVACQPCSTVPTVPELAFTTVIQYQRHADIERPTRPV